MKMQKKVTGEGHYSQVGGVRSGGGGGWLVARLGVVDNVQYWGCKQE